MMKNVRYVCFLASWLIGASPCLLAAETTIIPYLDHGYKYRIVPQGNDPGFEAPGYDDSAFTIGQAGFGSGDCVPSDWTHTFWPLNTDILLRKSFAINGSAHDLKVHVAIDNDIDVYLNGQLIGSEVREGCGERESFIFAVPDSLLKPMDNLLAVRARDRGVFSFVDLAVTADVVGYPFGVFIPRHTLKLGPLAADDSSETGISFTLAANSNGIDPLHEAVSLQVGKFSGDIPIGGFKRIAPDKLRFRGTVGGAKLIVDIYDKGARSYSLWTRVSNTSLAGTELPPTIRLVIGDDLGQAKLPVGEATFSVK